MDIPKVIVKQPSSDDSTTAKQKRPGKTALFTVEDRNKLHPLAARGLTAAKLRGLSRSDTNLQHPWENSQEQSDDDSGDSSEVDVPLLVHRRHTVADNGVDEDLRKSLENIRHNGSGQSGLDDDSVRKQKRNSIAVSLPRLILPRFRGKNDNSKSPETDSVSSDIVDKGGSSRYQPFGVIPGYALPKQNRKAVQENDDAFHAMWRRRRQASQASRPSLRSQERSSETHGEDSLKQKTAQGEGKMQETLRQGRQSALLQMMLTDEMERHAQEPEEREKLLDGVSSDDESAGPLKFFTNELSIRGRLRWFLIKNPTTRLVSTVFYLLVKIAICITYVARVLLDRPNQYACDGEPCIADKNDSNSSAPDEDSSMKFSSTNINWYVLLWVHRPLPLWIVEVVLAAMSLIRALFFIYSSNKGHRVDQIMTRTFALELICSLPMLATAAYPSFLCDMYVPTFLNCWLVKQMLERIFNDLHLTHQRFQTISVTLSQQMTMLVCSMLCLLFTTICGIQHIQRSSVESPLTMFESVYFVIVTFSTVGYGDISPDIWLGQAFILIMILVAFIAIPQKVEVLATTWMERKKMGGEFSYHAALKKKHVVVCSTSLVADTMMDFLNEFYAHPKLETHMVILMSAQELDSSMQVILKDPKWRNRVIYMKGSVLKDYDLDRCRIHQADACFFLAPRPATDENKADQHTILRSWAVKDFAPSCRQYIQLFKPENKMHVRFAEHVVCEDEFKYALLANNCLYPGLSTLVSVLIHTSSGLEGHIPSHAWQKIYGHHSGNSIYHIQLCKSIFFSRYEGVSFPSASADAHQRFGVTLLAVISGDDSSSRLRLNPGKDYILQEKDYCFYMSLMREEYAAIKPEDHRPVERSPSSMSENLQRIAEALETYQRRQEEVSMETEELDASVFNTITNLGGKDIMRAAQKRQQLQVMETDTVTNNNMPEDADCGQPLLAQSEENKVIRENNGNQQSSREPSAPETTADHSSEAELSNSASEDFVGHRHGSGRVLQYHQDMGQEKLRTGPPPVTIFTGSRKAVCHIMSTSRQHCCLHWGTDCEHCTFKNARDKRWQNDLIILVAQRASSGIFHFLVPLRSSFIAINGLCPIVLLLENEPDVMFLDTIAEFPLVYWMQGSITSLDDLLKAGIAKSCRVVVVNRQSHDTVNQEEILSDSDTILAVQTIFRMFPRTSIITELSQASNMRFMHFSTQNIYLQNVSRLEQKLRGTLTSNLNYMFRMPFAAGLVFSASMLDTLLYQTFVKGYLITFVRLLLGMDAEEGSGHLSSIRVRSNVVNLFPTYGSLYHWLSKTTGEIPIALYRTEKLVPTPRETSPTQSEEASGRRHKKEAMGALQNTQIFRSLFSTVDLLDTNKLVKNRLAYLNMPEDMHTEDKRVSDAVVSYVIANPMYTHKLRIGDIIYVIQPSSMKAAPSSRVRPQRSFSTSDLSMPKSHRSATDLSYLTVLPTRDKAPRSSQASTGIELKDVQPVIPVSSDTGGRRIGRFLLQRQKTCDLDTEDRV